MKGGIFKKTLYKNCTNLLDFLIKVKKLVRLDPKSSHHNRTINFRVIY